MEERNIEGWQYYKHAMIPTSAPHEEPDLSLLKSGEIWEKGFPLLVRWTSDWDCGYDTGWWYIVRERPFEYSKLSASSRRNIRKALRNCYVEKIDPVQYIDDLWRVFNEAATRYKNYIMPFDKDGFIREWINSGKDFWAGFENEESRMIGFATFEVHTDWVDYQVAKYSSEQLKLRVSDAINVTVLEYYLNKLGKRYISDGQRSVLHTTNVQNYLIEHFAYRKSYCKLHIRYRNVFGLLVKVMFPFRKTLRHLDGINRVHQINSILTMEEVVRDENG